MTRETKIGLLVGLAFIIVVGILLSDHFTNTVQPQQAPIAVIGENVRSGAQTPGTPGGATPGVVVPQHVQPQQPVLTQRDLNTTQPPPGVVVVGPNPDGGSSRVVIVAPPNGGGSDPGSVTNNPPPVVNGGGNDSSNNALNELAQRHGVEIVPVDNRNTQGNNNTIGPAVVPAGQIYQAQAGDTVSRMAARFYGANTTTNRDLIIKANPSLVANPNKVIVGQKYTIPTPQPVAPRNPVTPPAIVTPTPPVNNIRVATREEWYTTRDGDTLWKIAVEQTGSPRAMAAIVEMNRDVIRDVNVLKPDMKLRLPPKSVAVVQ